MLQNAGILFPYSITFGHDKQYTKMVFVLSDHENNHQFALSFTVLNKNVFSFCLYQTFEAQGKQAKIVIKLYVIRICFWKR